MSCLAVPLPDKASLTPRTLLARTSIATVIALVGLLAVPLCPTQALAQGAGAATELVTRAGKARAEKRYEDAIKLLTRAYEAYPDPRILFNTAKVYQDSADCQNALRFYVRTASAAHEHPEDTAELSVAIDKALETFTCGEDRETFAALLLSYSESPHPVVAMTIAAHYEEQGECVKSREMVMRARESPLVSQAVRARAEKALHRLECPDTDSGEAGSTSAVTYVAYGAGAVGLVSLIVAIVVDQQTVSDIDEFDNRAKPAFQEACPNRTALTEPRCISAYARASALQDDITSGQSTTRWAAGAGILMIGTGATLYYLDGYTDTFGGEETALRLLPLLSHDALGAVLRVEFR